MTREELQRRLEEAGAVMLSMPGGDGLRGFRSNLPQPIMEACEAYGRQNMQRRPPRPTSAQIQRMDEALAWVSLIPAFDVSADPASRNGGAALRRLIHMRLMVKPMSWYETPNNPQYIFPWRSIAAQIGADHRAVKVWHGAALGLIHEMLEQKMAA